MKTASAPMKGMAAAALLAALVVFQTGTAAGGEPRLAPAAAGAGIWHPLGGGLNDEVKAIAVAGPDLYVGGRFTNAGGIAEADSIARWDGAAGPGGAWHALGGGLNAEVDAIAVLGTDVYAGGAFTNAGGSAAADFVARWDGSAPGGGAWRPLGGGLNGWVYALAVVGPDLYAGGEFTDAGGEAAADYIARWDGSAWHAVGDGLNDWVYALTVAGSDLYAGGYFKDAGGDTEADYIARWDGAWHRVGGGLTDGVTAIAVAGPGVYAGGIFRDAGGYPAADYLARWNGAAWRPLGGALSNNVFALAVAGSDLYAGGQFTSAGGVAKADFIARWDGAAGPGGAWHAMGGGLKDWVYAIAVAGPDLYAGGAFKDAGGNPTADYIARWGPIPRDYWKFDEGGGPIAADSGAGNHPGAVSGAAWTASTAPTGTENPYALHFDGIDDKVEVEGLPQCAPFSVSAWIKADAWQAESYGGTIVGQDSGAEGPHGFALRAGDGGRLNFVVAAPIDGSGWPDATTGRVMEVRRWHHVAGTYDGAVERTYIDGQMQATRPVGAVFYPSTWPLRIGYGSMIPSRTFTGAIDDVRYFCRALTPEEVRDLAGRYRNMLPLVAR